MAKHATFYAEGNRSGDEMRIETDGCVVSITVGLTDERGRPMTRVDVVPDGESRGGDGGGNIWDGQHAEPRPPYNWHAEAVPVRVVMRQPQGEQ
jgi:hypothetical protein